MKNKKKLLGIVALATLFSTALIAGTTSLNTATPVSAESISTVAEFKIIDGASVRLATAKETQDGTAKNGIRFTAYVTDSYYANLLEKYSTATAITLKSTVSKVVTQGTPAPFEYSWDLTDFDSFDEQGVATFYHTITFDSLEGAYLTQANAFEMEADFWLEIETDTTVTVQADNADTVDTTRAMRQVAYMAYTTPSTTEKPNPTYQNETLKKYFGLATATNTVLDMDNKADLITAQMTGKTIDKAYVVDGDVWMDVTGKTVSGVDGVFTQADEYAGATKNLVYFDENNVAYPVATRFVTKAIANEADLKFLMGTQPADTAHLTDGIHWSNVKSRKGYYLLTSSFEFSGQPWSGTSVNRYFENGVFDGNGNTLTARLTPGWALGLFSDTYNVKIKNTHFNIIAINQKLSSTESARLSLFGHVMTNTVVENCLIDISATDTTAINRLDITTYAQGGRAAFVNCVINVADGIIAQNARTFGIANTQNYDGKEVSSHNCFFFANVQMYNDYNDTTLERAMFFTSVEEAAQAEYNWRGTLSELTKSEWWTYDKENKQLIFGQKAN